MWHGKLHWWILLGIVLGALIGWKLYSGSAPQARRTVARQEFFKQQPDLQPEALPSDLNRELNRFIESKVKEIQFLKDRAEAIRQALSNHVKSNFIYQSLDTMARVFTGLLRMIVIPLVFFTLGAGTLSLGDLKGLGRIGLKTAGWYVMTSFLAIVTGLALVNLICPGCGLDITVPRETQEASPSESLWDLLVDLLPGNMAATVAQFDMFAVILLALLLGIVLLRIPEGGHTVVAGLIKSGAPLDLTQQIMVVFLALTVSIGAAGIPHAGLVMMVIILKAVDLPLEYTALIWSVDRVLDMSRTMVNIWSDSTGAYVIAHSGT